MSDHIGVCLGGKPKSLSASPKVLAIMPTLACPAACSNCGSSSGPGRREKLDRATIMASIEQARDLGFVVVAFTGGEATLEWKTLLEGIQFASSIGLRTRLITNAHWAHSLGSAKKRLETLCEHGLTEVNYSTGDEHARFIPLERVVNATIAAVQCGLLVHIMIEYSAVRRITRDVILSHDSFSVLSPSERDKIGITESPWMPLDPSAMGAYAPGDTVDQINVTLREGCPSILQSYIIEADGRIGACCGLGISDISEMYVGIADGPGFLGRAIESAESDFIKLWIRCKGPEKILAWAARRNPAIRWEGLYAHNCQACHRLYKDQSVAAVIREHYSEAITDVIESMWFDEYYYPQRLARLWPAK